MNRMGSHILLDPCAVALIDAVYAPTQPDGSDPGAPYRLMASPTKVVESCHDGNNAPVDLDTCLWAPYSFYFKPTTNRAIIRP
jgi:hypothetical protein